MSDKQRLLGTLSVADGKGVVRMEDRFDTDAADLWDALTDPVRLARWLGRVEGDLRLGGEFRGHYFSSGWEGTGRVQECEPPHRLLVSTRGDGAESDHTIEMTLTADGEGTLLVIETRGMPENMVAGYGAGIQVHVEDLASYLAGGERCDSDARMKELFPAYELLAVGRA
jgi:uncharacterized protein YndB with AHSA1/START domain